MYIYIYVWIYCIQIFPCLDCCLIERLLRDHLTKTNQTCSSASYKQKSISFPTSPDTETAA